jgi:hypothetical protein
MDIQGGELNALKGMSKILSKNEDIILALEFWPYIDKQSGIQPKELVDILRENKFIIYEVNEEMRKLVPRLTNQLLNIYNQYDISQYINLLCLRNSNKCMASIR